MKEESILISRSVAGPPAGGGIHSGFRIGIRVRACRTGCGRPLTRPRSGTRSAPRPMPDSVRTRGRQLGPEGHDPSPFCHCLLIRIGRREIRHNAPDSSVARRNGSGRTFSGPAEQRTPAGFRCDHRRSDGLRRITGRITASFRRFAGASAEITATCGKGLSGRWPTNRALEGPYSSRPRKARMAYGGGVPHGSRPREAVRVTAWEDLCVSGPRRSVRLAAEEARTPIPWGLLTGSCPASCPAGPVVTGPGDHHAPGGGVGASPLRRWCPPPLSNRSVRAPKCRGVGVPECRNKGRAGAGAGPGTGQSSPVRLGPVRSDWSVRQVRGSGGVPASRASPRRAAGATRP